jgi:Lrp/AsnC family leucine-responsive transcriptional regulator
LERLQVALHGVGFGAIRRGQSVSESAHGISFLANGRSLIAIDTNFSPKYVGLLENHTMTDAPDIDRIDARILAALQRDGRLSNLKLAEVVALSPTATLARTQRLQREGFILGYEARLNPLKLGHGMLVFVEVLLDRTTPNVFDAFKAAVQVHGEILECHMVAGGFDYLLKTRSADMASYRDFAGRVLWQLPGVRETRTYAVMEEVKDTRHLPLGG